ncbi:hypothetical protein [Paenibacillus montanisoli]|uniref:Uncharacterized protein n=1 Tax=Paenibacillus montanisoli TaxID=2081970 RepID=A0A328TUH0_9BACL|nr:hypothetical protein [Paenibacillus montanisoli]RAP74189.1 hypothetical protein DL346_24310 [Paenibacillus montanisoli]
MNVTFDWNEWFAIFASSIAFLNFLIVRGYFSAAMVVIVVMYNIFLVSTIDYFLIATPFKVYIFGDNPSYELSGGLFHLFMYPSASLLFLFLYDKFELYGHKTVWYILGWTCFALLFEWICVYNRFLVYTGWKLYYSIPTYPIAAVQLILLYRFATRKLLQIGFDNHYK